MCWWDPLLASGESSWGWIQIQGGRTKDYSVCVCDAYINQEPKDVFVVLHGLHAHNMIVLSQLVPFVHTSHVLIVEIDWSWARDVNSAAIFLFPRYHSSIFERTHGRDDNDNFAVHPRSGYNVGVLLVLSRHISKLEVRTPKKQHQPQPVTKIASKPRGHPQFFLIWMKS